MSSVSASPLEVLHRYQQAMVAQNADDLADLYAPDAIHELPFLFPGMPTRLGGREDVRAAYTAAWGTSPARPTSVRTVAIHPCENREVLVVEQVVVGTNSETGHDFELPGVLVLHVREGRIARVRDYMDGLAVARAMDRLPAVVEALQH